MIDLEFLERLIRAVDESGIDSLEIERGGTRVRLGKTPSGNAVGHGGPAMATTTSPIPPSAPVGDTPAPAANVGNAEPSPADSVAAVSDFLEVTSPMVGTFYRSASPDAPPFTDVGERIAKGDTLCIIEAMKLMNELESEVRGTVVEVLVENGEPVEYGQVLFRVEAV